MSTFMGLGGGSGVPGARASPKDTRGPRRPVCMRLWPGMNARTLRLVPAASCGHRMRSPAFQARPLHGAGKTPRIFVGMVRHPMAGTCVDEAKAACNWACRALGEVAPEALASSRMPALVSS